MGKTLLPYAIMTTMVTDPVALDRMLDSAIPDNTSVNRKRRKERARMLTLARQKELQKQPNHPKKRGKKKK